MKKKENYTKEFNDININDKQNNLDVNDIDSKQDNIASKKNKAQKKTKETLTEVDILKAENEALKDDLKRIAAEFDNYQKRIKLEMQNAKKFANQDIIIELSNILNTFDLALKSAQDDDPLKQGVIMIKTMFINVLENNNVKFLDPVNKTFDYKLHEAVFTQKTSNKIDDNKIVEVYEKGLLLENRIIKPAKVKILIYEEPNKDYSNMNKGE